MKSLTKQSSAVVAAVALTIGAGLVLSLGSVGAADPGAGISIADEQVVSLQVTNDGLTNRYIRHQGGRLKTSVVDAGGSDLLKNDASFTVVRALDGTPCHSFESVNFPGRYIHVTGGTEMRTNASDGSAAFGADATFCSQGGLSGEGVSLVSRSRPNHYIRHANALVWLDEKSDSDLFRQDASWIMADAWSDDGDGGVDPCNPGAPTSLKNPVKREIAFQIVATAENFTLEWTQQYGYIEDIGDGRGYTGGIIGFTSGTSDMLALVEAYTRTSPNNGLARFLPALRDVNGSDSHAGLDPDYVGAWRAAASDPEFRAAQDSERDRQYFNPSVDRAVADGLGTLGQFIYYDAIVMHGPGNRSVDFGGIRATALRNATPPSQGGDEVAYLDAFLDARRAAMKTEPAHQNTDRVDTVQRKFLREGNLNLDTPLRWTQYGDSFEILSDPTPAN